MVSILEFSPKRGPVGSSVKIFGADFSAIPSENKVTFTRAGRKTGVSAVVVSAAPNVLVVKVPPGASTGLVTVTAPSGSAASGGVFLVEAEVTTRPGPTIREVAPAIAAAGTEITIKGTDFDPSAANDTVMFNRVARAIVKAATATELVVRVPAGSGSGRILLSTPIGEVVSHRDFFIPPLFAPRLRFCGLRHDGRSGPGVRGVPGCRQEMDPAEEAESFKTALMCS